MSTSPMHLSVRAASWVGSQCVRYYCARNGIVDPDVDEFCRYIEALATTSDVSGWFEAWPSLPVSGLGEALPNRVCRHPGFAQLIQNVHEISACQIYGAWQPEEQNRFLQDAARIADYPLHRVYEELKRHTPLLHGWGDPVDEATIQRWRTAALSAQIS